MRTPIINRSHVAGFSPAVFAGVLALTLAFSPRVARADETCSSPYLASINGQEEFVYVWTLGVDGLGDGMDKLVTDDANPDTPKYAKDLTSVSF